MYTLKKWRVYLEGQPFLIQTDHHSLKYLQTQPNLSHCQAQWVETLQEFDFGIDYILGKTNTVADALSRHPDLQMNNVSVLDVATELRQEIQEALHDDQDFGKILSALQNP